MDSGALCELEPACLSGSSCVTTGLPVDFMEYELLRIALRALVLMTGHEWCEFIGIRNKGEDQVCGGTRKLGSGGIEIEVLVGCPNEDIW